MNVGYKQSEAGAIPEAWTVERIAECCEYADYRGKTPPKTSSGTFLVTAKNVRKGFIDYEESQEYVPTELYDQIMRRGRPRIGDILITTEAPLGNVAQVNREDVALAQRIIKYRPKSSRLLPDYLKQYFLSERFQRILNDHASGSTAKGIKGSVLHQLPVVIPPALEQRAIAAALSDGDALLDALDRIIAKKRDLKQAAMQQLLTGQTRLPGFHGEWPETTLGDIGECVIGLTYKPENVVEHGLLVLRASNIQSGRLAFDDNVYVNLKVPDHLVTRTGDILICVRNGSRALIGKCAVIDERSVGLTFGAFMSVYRTEHWRFIAHAFQGDYIQRQIRDNMGATINQITNKDMRSYRLKLPDESEQAAIAEVLSDMDAELAALEQRREKTRDIKQAMMQELLTGKTRLI